MTEERQSWCRECASRCGVRAHREGHRAIAEGDPDHPLSMGFFCDDGRRSVDRIPDDRITTPMRRDGDRWVAATWDEAYRDIGARLGQIRKDSARAVAIHAGRAVGSNPRDVARIGAFAVQMGTPHLFSEAASWASPFLYATEQVVGRPWLLQADVGRANFSVLFDAEPSIADLGPLQGGWIVHRWQDRMRKAKKARLVVADARKTAAAAGAEVWLPIRPGTETEMILGMLAAAVQGKWYDSQYVRDYVRGFDALADALRPWSVERAARICGVDPGALSGAALKFARAPMATMLPGRGLLSNGKATIGSFALLALHAVTANLLRPGGMYDAPGIVDLEGPLSLVPTKDAPKSGTGFPSVVLQLPTSLLADEGEVRALIACDGDPLDDGPAARTDAALAKLSLYVQIGPRKTASSRHAHWILPSPDAWERQDSLLLETARIPIRYVALAPPIASAPADSRPVEAILAGILGATSVPWRGGVWGGAVLGLGKLLATSDLASWERRASDLLSDVDAAALARDGAVMKGDIDRSRWRPVSGGLEVGIEPFLRDIAALPDRELAAGEFWLGCRPGAAERPTIEVHPDHVGTGRAILGGSGGDVAVDVVGSPDLRADTVIFVGGWGRGVRQRLSFLAPADRDAYTGVARIAGSPVTISPDRPSGPRR